MFKDECNKSFIFHLLSFILINECNQSFILHPLSFILYPSSFIHHPNRPMLYIVPTQVGHLEDITLTPLRVLKEVSLLL